MAPPDKDNTESERERKAAVIPGFVMSFPPGPMREEVCKALNIPVPTYWVGGEGIQETLASPTLATASSRGEPSQDLTTTSTKTLAKTQTPRQPTLQIKDRAASSTNASIPKATADPLRPSEGLKTTMETIRKAKEKDGKSKPPSRAAMQSYQNKRVIDEKNPKFCPGPDNCRSLTCNHTNLKNATALEIKEAEMSHKAKRVLETCQEAGYKVTLDYARQWVDHCPGDLHIASRAVMYDIELRESVLKEGGRISLSVETAIAAGSLGRDERDAVLDYIEKDERLFKEFEKNGEQSVWGMRCEYAADEAIGRRWFEACTHESKYRTSRQKHFNTLREKVSKGEMTQEYMNICLERIDTAHAQMQADRFQSDLHLEGNTSTRVGNTKESRITASSSSTTGSNAASNNNAKGIQGQAASLKTPGFKVANAAPTRSGMPIRTAAPDNSNAKDKGKGKQAYVEDEAEPEDRNVLSADMLRARAEVAFRTLYARSLPSSISLRQVVRFMNSLPMHDPKVQDIEDIKRAIDVGYKYNALAADLFEAYVLRAEWFMEHRYLATAEGEEEAAVALNVATENKQAEGKKADTYLENDIELEKAMAISPEEALAVGRKSILLKVMATVKQERKQDESEGANTYLDDYTEIEKAIAASLEEVLTIARFESKQEDSVEDDAYFDDDIELEKAIAASLEELPSGATEPGLSKAINEATAQSRREENEKATYVDDDVQMEKAIAASLEEVPRVAKEPSLFKAMAKAKVESKRKEAGRIADEVMSAEMRARSALASGSAAQSAKAHKTMPNLQPKETRKADKKGSKRGAKKVAAQDNVRYRIKLKERAGKMLWPPMAANFMAPGFDNFLAYQGEASTKLLRALALRQIDIVGGMFMMEDGPGDAEDVAFIKEMTTITSDRLAQLFLGLGANSAALATRLYHKFEIEVKQYFAGQMIVPFPPDFENEALRFAIWMYMARDLDNEDEGKKEKEKESKLEQIKTEDEKAKDEGDKSGEGSKGLDAA